QRLKISGGGAKRTHQLLVVAVGHAGHDLMCPNIEARGVEVDGAHPLAGTGFTLRRSGTMASAELAHEGTPGEDETRVRPITLDHLCCIACSSGSTPPVSNAWVIENHVARRDVSHQSVVGSQLVIVPLYYTLRRCGAQPCFCGGDCP